MKSYQLGSYIFELLEGDITEIKVDSIVNAANTSLILGAGVAGAIRRKGGPSIQEECNKLAPIKTGEAVITNGGNIYAKFVIHAVGPIYANYSSEEAETLLKSSVLNSLEFIHLKSLKSIAFPAISAGVYGFPPTRCAEIMISAILQFIGEKKREEIFFDGKIKIIICLYGLNMYSLFKDVFLTLIEKEKS